MAERLVAAFAAGLVSIAFPCVLPLVPGYLSAISEVEVDRLGERGVARRIVTASVPFAAGFTIVFVVLGAFQALEEVLVVDDVAILLVLAVQPVHAADRLEEAVVPHLLVDLFLQRVRD